MVRSDASKAQQKAFHVQRKAEVKAVRARKRKAEASAYALAAADFRCMKLAGALGARPAGWLWMVGMAAHGAVA